MKISATLITLALAQLAHGSLTVWFEQNGSDVEISVTGDFDLTGWNWGGDSAIVLSYAGPGPSYIGHATGTQAGVPIPFEQWTNPAGFASASGYDSYGGIVSNLVPTSGTSMLYVIGSQLNFTGIDDNQPDPFDPGRMETLVYQNTTLLAMLGDDDFSVTYTFPDPDGPQGPGISESVTFVTAAVPETSGALAAAVCLAGILGFRSRRH